MYEKGRKRGTVRIAVKPGKDAKKVEVAGDFNDWEPTKMQKQKDGSYVRNVETGAGIFQYKFIVDGQWMLDPDNSVSALNPYGSLNSVAQFDG